MFRVGIDEQLVCFSLPGDYDDKIRLVIEHNGGNRIEKVDPRTFDERKVLIQQILERTQAKLMGIYKVFASLEERTVEIEFDGPIERIKFEQYVSGFFFPYCNPEKKGTSSLVFRVGAARIAPVFERLGNRLEHCEVEDRDRRPRVNYDAPLRRAIENNQRGLVQRILDPQRQDDLQAARGLTRGVADRLLEEARALARAIPNPRRDPEPPPPLAPRIPPLRRAPAFRVDPGKVA